MDAGKLLDVAVERIKSSLKDELEKNPDVLDKLVRMVDDIATDTKDKK